MKISIDDISKRNDPYQLFLDNIKSAETKRKYKKSLFRFLESIPNEIYQKNLGKTPKEPDEIILSALFVELAKTNQDLAADVIATYIREKAS